MTDRTEISTRLCMVGLALIALATVVVYWPALGGEILWDDDAHIPRPELRSTEGLGRIWFDIRATQQYYPLLFSSFWLQHKLWGDAMLGYHLVNLAWHLGAALLVYTVLRKLQIPGALLATALFALHPVHVESVAWITEQKNTQSAVFYLGAMLAYLHFDANRRWSWYALALALFVGALLSKTVTVTLPPALLLIFWWQRGTLSWRHDVLPLAPFFALALADGLLTMWVERAVLGAEGQDFDLTFVEGLLLSGRALWFYLEKLLWPVNLIFIYPRWKLDPGQWWQWLFPLGFLALLAALWAIRRRTRGPLAGALFFAGTLFPVLGFLNVYFFRFSFVSDHFPYLASLGLIVPLAAGVVLAIERLAPQARAAGYACCLLILGALGFLAWEQSHLYGGDVLRLYDATLAKNPDCWWAHNNLGVLDLNRGRPAEAINHFKEAMRDYPNSARIRYNLGKAAIQLGDVPQAIEHFKQALQIEQAVKPPQVVAEAYFNLGAALVVSEPASAIEHLEQAVKLKPDHAAAHNLLGEALFKTGQREPAVAQFEEAVRLEPELVDAWANLAVARAQTTRAAEAIAAAERAIELATAQGKTMLAQQLAGWLAQFRAAQQNGPVEEPTPPTLPPAP